MTAPLDEKARDAALAAWFANTAQGWHAAMEAAIRAYLAASPSPSMEMEVVAIDATDRDMIARGDRIGAKLARQLLAHHDQAQSALAAMRAERDEARQIVRDTHWMAVRYADGRQSYAVGMCADALRKAYDAGWLVYSGGHPHHDLDPQYPRDGSKPEYRSIEGRAETAEAQVLRLTEENEALRKERDRCHVRLEIDHVWVMGDNDDSDLERRDIPLAERGEIPDGIECRDATIAVLEHDASADKARIKALEDALSHALDHYDRNTCLHESVHRGGSIWTICDDCGRQWADDKGGFQPHVDPADIAAARSALKENAL